jgi:hypothetical protein
MGRSRALLSIERIFLHALPVALLAALACGAGAAGGARLLAGHGDVASLAGAMVCAGILYGGTVLAFRRRLPLGRA